jgi:hypothetical protein
MTTITQIGSWFDLGVAEGKTHLIVVCDTFDHEDYPVFAKGDEEALNKYENYNGLNMQRVMEVYDLRKPKDPQIRELRAMHLPKKKR